MFCHFTLRFCGFPFMEIKDVSHLLELRREIDHHYNLVIIIISHPHVK
jgi:hypothetical protein